MKELAAKEKQSDAARDRIPDGLEDSSSSAKKVKAAGHDPLATKGASSRRTASKKSAKQGSRTKKASAAPPITEGTPGNLGSQPMDLEEEYVEVVEDDADAGEGGTSEEQPTNPKDKEEDNQVKLDQVISPPPHADPDPVYSKVEVINVEDLPREDDILTFFPDSDFATRFGDALEAELALRSATSGVQEALKDLHQFLDRTAPATPRLVAWPKDGRRLNRDERQIVLTAVQGCFPEVANMEENPSLILQDVRSDIQVLISMSNGHIDFAGFSTNLTLKMGTREERCFVIQTVPWSPLHTVLVCCTGNTFKRFVDQCKPHAWTHGLCSVFRVARDFLIAFRMVKNREEELTAAILAFGAAPAAQLNDLWKRLNSSPDLALSYKDHRYYVQAIWLQAPRPKMDTSLQGINDIFTTDNYRNLTLIHRAVAQKLHTEAERREFQDACKQLKREAETAPLVIAVRVVKDDGILLVARSRAIRGSLMAFFKATQDTFRIEDVSFSKPRPRNARK